MYWQRRRRQIDKWMHYPTISPFIGGLKVVQGTTCSRNKEVLEVNDVATQGSARNPPARILDNERGWQAFGR